MERFFHSELETVRTDVIRMGRKSVDILRLAVRGLIEHDENLLNAAIAADDEVDELNKVIDSNAIRYITLRAPVASDVRLLTVAMKYSGELERIADEAVSIAKRARRVNAKGDLKDYYKIPQMAELVLLQLNAALDAFTEERADKAHLIPQKDKEIDALHRSNYDKLASLILDKKKLSASCIDMIFISKSLERVGDHSANMAEEVVFILEGEDIRHTEETKHQSTD